ncbi:hypothetical protein QQ045_020808 [Rhodiola kirilowii]
MFCNVLSHTFLTNSSKGLRNAWSFISPETTPPRHYETSTSIFSSRFSPLSNAPSFPQSATISSTPTSFPNPASSSTQQKSSSKPAAPHSYSNPFLSSSNAPPSFSYRFSVADTPEAPSSSQSRNLFLTPSLKMKSFACNRASRNLSGSENPPSCRPESHLIPGMSSPPAARSMTMMMMS